VGMCTSIKSWASTAESQLEKAVKDLMILSSL
jgi:hypothetical protein